MLQIVVLLVEGNRASENSVAHALEKAGFCVVLVPTGKAALAEVKTNKPNLVIFNASMMRSNGARSCRRLRHSIGTIPIIHIRTEGWPEEQEAEADVYLERPFTPRKLFNRIKALLPPDYGKEEIVRCGDLTYYRTKRSVEVVGKGESRLTPKLALLLEEFVRHPNEIITRRQLMQNVWQTDYVGDTRTLDVHIRWIRELIEQDPAYPRRLQTVRGRGYIFLANQ